MTNKERLLKVVKKIGCYDKEMELLNPANLKKVINALDYGSDTDVHICINRKKYVVEICMDGLNEVDFHVMTLKEYDELY